MARSPRALASLGIASSLVLISPLVLAEEPEPTPTDATPSPVSTPPAAEPAGAAEPFAFADFSWAPGNYGSSDRPLKFGPFTGEVRLDTVYHYSFNHPSDDTIVGSSEVFRSNEVQVTQIGFG